MFPGIRRRDELSRLRASVSFAHGVLLFYMSSLSNASSVPHPRIQTPDEFSMGYVRFRVANGRYYWRNRRI